MNEILADCKAPTMMNNVDVGSGLGRSSNDEQRLTKVRVLPRPRDQMRPDEFMTLFPIAFHYYINIHLPTHLSIQVVKLLRCNKSYESKRHASHRKELRLSNTNI
jgi:hypothetical protein